MKVPGELYRRSRLQDCGMYGWIWCMRMWFGVWCFAIFGCLGIMCLPLVGELCFKFLVYRLGSYGGMEGCLRYLGFWG